MPEDQREPTGGERWARLTARVGIGPRDPVLIALSGGADSVLLLHLAAWARPRPPVWAAHVEHELRGTESREDSEFCLRLCAGLEVPFVRLRAPIDPDGGNLEARARRARYRVLAAEARRLAVTCVATGHHADDALETLLMRWLRGTAPAGLAGLRARSRVAGARVVRPLIDMRREEVRELLTSHGLYWREDSSNTDARFTRNRVRHELLDVLSAACGPEARRNLLAFGREIETLEGELAVRTAHVVWRPPVHAAARRTARDAHIGGSLPRSALARLVLPLRRRALWRLLTEGTSRAPTREVLERILSDLALGRCARHHLPGGWSLQLRSDLLHLSPPPAALAPLRPALIGRERNDPPTLERANQALMPFGEPAGARPGELELKVGGGAVHIADGRSITAEWVDLPSGADVPRSEVAVELDPGPARAPLRVRFPRSGDRFRGLGAPGHRPLTRFLADAGIPREERSRVPLVFAGEDLLWVAGLRPGECGRVLPGTTRRLRLELHDAAEGAFAPQANTALYAD
ncbi:MAG: tRNA lysidine(34) synthetase TilS [Planctomycetota bacterium]|nr:tRNA lysidine(34) synthetase TilS [Planctomycetota bacterium]